MNNIWANRLIAGTKIWDECPDSRKEGVRMILKERVEAGEITAKRYAEITGEEYSIIE